HPISTTRTAPSYGRLVKTNGSHCNLLKPDKAETDNDENKRLTADQTLLRLTILPGRSCPNPCPNLRKIVSSRTRRLWRLVPVPADIKQKRDQKRLNRFDAEYERRIEAERPEAEAVLRDS